MKIVQSILSASLSVLFYGELQAASVATEVLQSMQAGADKNIPVIVRFRDKANINAVKAGTRSARRTRVISLLQEKSAQSQKSVRQRLETVLDKSEQQSVRNLWLINALAVSLPPRVIEELSRHQDVESISLDAKVSPVSLNVAASVEAEWNLRAIGADTLWQLGYSGQNTVIGTMDSGVDVQHQDLQSRWRGGDNSWFDPYGQHSTPYDAYGHGTQTMGVAVGGDAGGTSIGVAPGAKWIAVKIFNDAGTGTLSRIHEGFQWMLDPDNNPQTDDAPDVVNNSWNLQESINSCNSEFQTDIEVLRYADIAVVFSSGNSGPYASSSLSPANNAGSFETGAVDVSLNIAYSSGRGPSACDGGIYPQVSAPGFDIRTADLTFGGAIPDLYTTVSGTSFAAAHVAGAVALLRSASASASIDAIETALQQSAFDAGEQGADNDYGWGVINVAAAYERLQTPVVEAPVAMADSYSVSENSNLSIAAPGVLGNDSGSTALTAVLSDTTTHGVLLLDADGSFTYTPNAGFSGTDNFTYVADGGAGGVSAPANVVISVLVAVNVAPVANNDVATTVKTNPVSINLLANDADVDGAIDPGSIVIVASPKKGNVVVNGDGSVTYTANIGRIGIDSFSYQMTDNDGAVSNVATVSINILKK